MAKGHISEGITAVIMVIEIRLLTKTTQWYFQMIFTKSIIAYAQ